jgi:hypothetical protein
VPKLRASGSVPQSPSSNKPDQCSPSPLTSGSPSFRCRSAAFVNDLPLGPPFSKPDRLPSRGNRSSDPSVSPPFIPYPLGPPFSKPNNEIPAAHVSKPTHSAPLAPSSSSEALGRPLISPLTYPPQSNSNSQPLAPRSVTSSSQHVPSFSNPGSTASAPSSPSKSNVEPHPLCMAHNVMGIRKDTPAVCCSALIRLAGIDLHFQHDSCDLTNLSSSERCHRLEVPAKSPGPCPPTPTLKLRQALLPE